MSYVADNPLIVQGDHTVLLEVMSPRAAEARDALLGFAELVKSPEYVHTWRITPLSLWNAAAAGHTPDEVLAQLTHYAKYPLPQHIEPSIRDKMGRYGTLRLLRDGAWLVLEADEPVRMTEIRSLKIVEGLLGEPIGPASNRIAPQKRGELKQLLTAAGFPVQDLAGYEDGDALEMALSTETSAGAWSLRDYQVDAIDALIDEFNARTGLL